MADTDPPKAVQSDRLPSFFDLLAIGYLALAIVIITIYPNPVGCAWFTGGCAFGMDCVHLPIMTCKNAGFSIFYFLTVHIGSFWWDILPASVRLQTHIEHQRFLYSWLINGVGIALLFRLFLRSYLRRKADVYASEKASQLSLAVIILPILAAGFSFLILISEPTKEWPSSLRRDGDFRGLPCKVFKVNCPVANFHSAGWPLGN